MPLFDPLRRVKEEPEKEWWEAPVEASKRERFLRISWARNQLAKVDQPPSFMTKVDRAIVVNCFIPGLSEEAVPDVYRNPQCMPQAFKFISQWTGYADPAVLLFASGNVFADDPDYMSPNDVLKRAPEHDRYRAMLCVKDIRVIWDVNDKPVWFQAELLQAVGCTPIRERWRGPVYKQCDGTLSGRWHAWAQDVTDEGVPSPVCKVRIEMAFRLAGVALVFANLMSAVDAPYVWITLTLQLQKTSAQAKLEGTVIPSQTLYIGDKRQAEHHYNMLNVSCEALNAFMRTGSEKLAEGRPEGGFWDLQTGLARLPLGREVR